MQNPAIGPVPPLPLSRADRLHVLADEATKRRTPDAGNAASSAGNPSPKRPGSPTTAELVQCLVALQARRHMRPNPLDMRYEEITLTSAARAALDNALTTKMKSNALPSEFYRRLWAKEAKSNWRQYADKVMERFGDFLAGKEQNLQTVMSNFRNFAEAALGCQDTLPDVKDCRGGITAGDARNTLQDLCERSFWKTPLKHHVESRIRDPLSPLHELWNGGKTHPYLGSNLYLLDIHFAASGMESAGDGIKRAEAKEFIETMRKIMDKYSENKNLLHFVRLLRRDAYPSPLDDALRGAIDRWAQSGKKMPSKITIGQNKRTVDELVEYACAHDIESKDFLKLLADLPTPVPGQRAAPGTTMKEDTRFKSIVQWCRSGPSQLRTTIGVIKIGLSDQLSLPAPEQ